MLRIVERQEQVLEDLGEPETFGVVDFVCVTAGHIVDVIEADKAGWRLQECLE